MNRRFHTLLSALTVTGILFASIGCATPDEVDIAQDLGAEAASPSILAVNEGGILHFASPEDFFESLDVLSDMSPDALDAWEEEIGFASARSVFHRLGERLVAAETEEERAGLLRDHADVAVISGDELRPRIRAAGYAAFTNRDGLFYVAGTLHKVTPDKIVSSEDGSLDTINSALAVMDRAGSTGTHTAAIATGGVRVSYLMLEDDGGGGGGGSSGGGGSAPSCTNSVTGWYNGSDRKLDLQARTFKYYCAGCCGNYYYQVRFELEMQGYKKNIWGNWVHYRTTYDTRNVAYEINAPVVTGFDGVKSIFYTEQHSANLAPESLTDELQTWTLTYSVGNQVQNSDIATPCFTKVKAQASSRGTGGNWANICFGYVGGCGF